MITINRPSSTDRSPLYHKYPQQTNPQGAYIEIDCENESVRAYWNGEIGNAIPFSVYHGHDRRYGVPGTLHGMAITRLFEDPEFVALCQRIVDGYESHWDGNNHVARLDDDAREAEQELESMLERYFDEEDNVQVWDVREYLYEERSREINAETSDDALAKWVADSENISDNDNAIIDGDVEDFANEHRYEKRTEKIEQRLDDDYEVLEYRNMSRENRNPVYEYERNGKKYNMQYDASGTIVETLVEAVAA